jgi:HlyD family secretion protein
VKIPWLGLGLRRGWLLSAIVAAGAFVLGVAGVWSSLGGTGVGVVVVNRGPFVREVIATGTLKAAAATPIVVPPESGRQQKISFIARDGARLEAGDLVVEFDPFEARREEADGRADLAAATAKMDKVAADSAKTSRGLGLDRDVAKEELQSALTFELSDEALFSRNAVIESRLDKEFSTRRADLAGRKITASERVASTDKTLRTIEAGKARFKIENAEKGLRSLRILAPHDGVLVLQRAWTGSTPFVGDSVWPGQKIAEIPDLSVLEGRVFVLEADAVGLKAGLTARLSLEGRPGPEYAATVSRVEPLAKPRARQSPVKYFETTLKIDRPDPAVMGPGQRIRAAVLIENVPAVIAIPRGALFEKDGRRIVYRQEGGRFEPREVRLGPNSVSRVVIVSGLAPGDRIALRDPTLPLSGPPAGAGPPGKAAP